MSKQDKKRLWLCIAGVVIIFFASEFASVMLILNSGYVLGSIMSAGLERGLGFIAAVCGVGNFILGKKAEKLKRPVGIVIRVVGIVWIINAVFMFVTAGMFPLALG